MFAVLIWALAMQWRRQWPSFAIVTLALAILLFIMSLIGAWREQLPPMAGLLYELMWPYVGLTGAIGYYICFLPRPPTDMQCARCRYDLSGLKHTGLRCPECGTPWRGKGSEHEPSSIELTPILKSPPAKRRIM